MDRALWRGERRLNFRFADFSPNERIRTLLEISSNSNAIYSDYHLTSRFEVYTFMRTIFALCNTLGAIWMSWAASDPTVAVTGGQIRGVSLINGGAVFKGIPFAAPPVGDLRWREPQPVTPWPGVRDTTKPGPICAQKPTFIA